jgi:PKD repeat protein
MKVGIILVIVCAAYQFATGQPVADFLSPPQGCLNQNIQLINQSVSASEYFWDFNQGDLLLTPETQTLTNPGGNIPYGLETVYDGVNWFGFITNRGDNSINRLDFGNSLDNTPTTFLLTGILGSVSPTDIELVFTENEWFGFVYGASQLVTRLDFGNSLTNIPTATPVIAGSGGGDSGLEIEYDGNAWYIVYTIGSPSQVGVAKLNNIRSIPTISEKKINLINGGSSVLGDIKLLRDQFNWYAYAVSNGGSRQVIQLSFGNDLLSDPTTSNISGTSLNTVSPYGIDVAFDNGKYIAFISTNEGNLFRIDLSEDLTQAPLSISDLGKLNNLSNTLKIKLQKQSTRWFAFSISWSSNALFKISFPNPSLTGSLATSSLFSPEIVYSNPGTYFFSLKASNGAAHDELQKSILIENKIAPDLDFVLSGICVQNSIQFQSQSGQSLTSHLWTFGDGGTSSSAMPSHSYSVSGGYNVKLEVQGTNGCSNQAIKMINIANAPVSDFLLPSVSPFCTNQTYPFTNSSAYDPISDPTWEWRINGALVSNNQDLMQQFNSASAQEIRLKAIIPGCENEMTKNIASVQEGPEADFIFSNSCQLTPVGFTNTTTGTVTDYSWSFGDGNISTLTNPTNTFQNSGTYQVTLNTTNTAGCQNSAEKTITIYSKPQTNFSIDLPPFSCAGSPSQFNDLTPTLTDSNIATWSWNFGDVENGSSSQKNPTYTYALAGDYQVSLSATTNFGCNAAIQKQVTISTAPSVNFSNGIACFNQGTQFTDASDPTAKAWLWSVQNSIYTTKNPTHVFTATGSLPVILTVTGNNNCISQISKQVNVPVPIVPDFTALNKCVGKSTVFQEINVNGNDPAVSWSWDFVGQGVSNGSPAEHIFPNTGSFAVKMNTTRQSGCVYSVTKSITINQSPHAQFTPSTESGGSPLTVGFSNMSTQANSYLWKFKDANNTTSTDFSPSFIFNQIGGYPVELIASNSFGCEDSYERIIQVVVPSINATLSDFKLIPSGGSMKARVTITNLGNVSITNPDVFVDLSGNATIKEKVIATILPNQSITQTLSVDILPKNLRYACAELNLVSDKYSFDNRQCINLETETLAVQPYPNPAQDELFIDWINQESESMQIIIYNASGQVVLDKKYEPTLSGLNQVKVNISDLKSGIYFVSYFDEYVTRNARFSIVR